MAAPSSNETSDAVTAERAIELSRAEFLWHVGPPSESARGPIRDFVNGLAGECDACMPCSLCSKCNKGIHCSRQVLPYACPPDLRHLLADKGTFQPPLSENAWSCLVHQFDAHNARIRRVSVINPGASFPPFTWRVPSKPDGDIFWPVLDLPAVGKRLRDIIEHAELDGVSCFRIRVAHAGILDANTRPLPTGDVHLFEKMLELPRMKDKEREKLEFYTLIVPEPKGDPRTALRFVKGLEACSGCFATHTIAADRENDRRIEHYRTRHRDQRTIPRHETLAQDAFKTWLYDGIMVSDRFRDLILPLHLANMAIEKIVITDEAPDDCVKE